MNKRKTEPIKSTIVHGAELPLSVSAPRRTIINHVIDEIPSTSGYSKSYLNSRDRISSTASSILKSRRSTQSSTNKPPSISTRENNIAKDKRSFKKPSLYSIETLTNNISNLNFEELNEADLSSNSKNIVYHEVTKKLNFPCDKQVYTDLITIDDDDNSDCQIIETKKSSESINDKYLKSKSKKDKIPNLEDFIAPRKKIEIKVPLYNRKLGVKAPNIDSFKVVHEIETFHPSYINIPI